MLNFFSIQLERVLEIILLNGDYFMSNLLKSLLGCLVIVMNVQYAVANPPHSEEKEAIEEIKHQIIKQAPQLKEEQALELATQIYKSQHQKKKSILEREKEKKSEDVAWG